MIYIGIDPGVSGGLAMIAASGDAVAIKMPPTHRDIYTWLVAASSGNVSKGAIEFVRSSPQMGVSSAFTFGRGLGALEMALVAAGISFDHVLPRKWQQAMGCLSGGDKNVTKRRAQEMFPHLTITHAVADALLIAEWCRRFHS